MAGHAHQGVLIQAPVLHELAGQLHRIPLHVADPSGFRLLNGGEHVLQTMAEFVEEGFDLLKAHQAGGLSHGGGLVADQISHRKHEAAVAVAVTSEAFVHPGSTAFAGGTAVGIQIERGDRFTTTAPDMEETHIAVPDRSLPIGRRDLNIKEAGAEAEQAIEHLRQWEPGAQRFLVQIKPFAPQFFRPVAHVPGS